MSWCRKGVGEPQSRNWGRLRGEPPLLGTALGCCRPGQAQQVATGPELEQDQVGSTSGLGCRPPRAPLSWMCPWCPLSPHPTHPCLRARAAWGQVWARGLRSCPWPVGLFMTGWMGTLPSVARVCAVGEALVGASPGATVVEVEVEVVAVGPGSRTRSSNRTRTTPTGMPPRMSS